MKDLLSRLRVLAIVGAVGVAVGGGIGYYNHHTETTKKLDQVAQTTTTKNTASTATTATQQATTTAATEQKAETKDRQRAKHKDFTRTTVIDTDGRKTITEHFFEDDQVASHTGSTSASTSATASTSASTGTTSTTTQETTVARVETHQTETTKPAESQGHWNLTGMAGLDLRAAARGSVESWYGGELDYRIVGPLYAGLGGSSAGDIYAEVSIDLTPKLNLGVLAGVNFKDLRAHSFKPYYGASAQYRLLGPLGVGATATLDGSVSGYISVTVP